MALFSLPHFVLLLLYISYLYMLQTQTCNVTIITLYNFMSSIEAEKRRDRDYPGGPVVKTALPVQGAWV